MSVSHIKSFLDVITSTALNVNDLRLKNTFGERLSVFGFGSPCFLAFKFS